MDFTALAKYIRMSPRKVRLVAGHITKLAVKDAHIALSAVPRRASGPLADILQSAVANAKQKQASEDGLWVSRIDVMVGPSMKRWRAVSRGQTHGYKKRMTHIRVILTDEKNEKLKL